MPMRLDQAGKHDHPPHVDAFRAGRRYLPPHLDDDPVGDVHVAPRHVPLPVHRHHMAIAQHELTHAPHHDPSRPRPIGPPMAPPSWSSSPAESYRAATA